MLSTLSILTTNAAMADNPVAFRIGEAQFFNGDNVTIESVTSSGDGFEAGATITVTGTYTLNSTDEARLCFYTTRNPKPNDPAEISTELDSQRMKVKRGTNAFKLSKVAAGDGGPHITFYGPESAFGGVYFGDESNVWMKKGWSYDAPKSVPARPAIGGSPGTTGIQ
ncbi:hypothetical protein CEE69_07770 [Rhodopirellula bahusiensis]|nr:hypothetical protein CEE69_07770 [Rhodopirellula bahusiensis]